MNVGNMNNNHQQQDEQNNQNQFINDEIGNNNSLYSDEELNYSSKYTKITLSFIIILILKIFFLIYFHYFQNSEKFSFQYYLIIKYNQYYRCITRYFINYGFCHFIFELYITYLMCYYFENMIGTIFTIVTIFLSMFLISFINIIVLQCSKYIYNFTHHKHNLEIIYEGGLTPLLFTLYSFYFSFEGNSNKIFFLLFVFVVRAKKSEYLIVLLLIFFTPNNSIYGNISGILTANLLFCFKKSIFPRIIWIKEIENLLKLHKIFPLYRFITEESPIMKKILIEFDNNLINELNEYDDMENGQQMTELTLLSSESDNINNNIANQNNNS